MGVGGGEGGEVIYHLSLVYHSSVFPLTTGEHTVWGCFTPIQNSPNTHKYLFYVLPCVHSKSHRLKILLTVDFLGENVTFSIARPQMSFHQSLS